MGDEQRRDPSPQRSVAVQCVVLCKSFQCGCLHPAWAVRYLHPGLGMPYTAPRLGHAVNCIPTVLAWVHACCRLAHAPFPRLQHWPVGEPWGTLGLPLVNSHPVCSAVVTPSVLRYAGHCAWRDPCWALRLARSHSEPCLQGVAAVWGSAEHASAASPGISQDARSALGTLVCSMLTWHPPLYPTRARPCGRTGGRVPE